MPRRTSRPGPSPAARGARLLSRREHSAKELRRKLVARGVSGDDAAQAVEELGREGWQSDRRYAESIVRHRSLQGYGPRRIEAELKVAGVEGGIAAEALAAAGVDWDALAARVHERRFRTLPKSGAERARQYHYLQGRGFDSEQIRRVLKGDLWSD